MKASGHVTGEEKGRIMLFALSTCVWCRKTRALLDQLGVAYEYVYVDLLAGAERDRVLAEMARWNPQESFPTLVIDDERAILGFKEGEIREALG